MAIYPAGPHLRHKRGDTLRQEITVVDPGTGAFLNLTGWSLASQVRNGEALVETLTVQAVDLSGGQVRLLATAAQTALWPIGILYCDVELTAPDGFRISTATIAIDLIEDVTR